jgi:hypothetical protein
MKLEDDRYERHNTVRDALVLEGICAKLCDLFGNIQIEEMFLRLMKQEEHWIEDIVVSYNLPLSVFQNILCIIKFDIDLNTSIYDFMHLILSLLL